MNMMIAQYLKQRLMFEVISRHNVVNRPDMTEKLLTGTLSLNTTNNVVKSFHYHTILFVSSSVSTHGNPFFSNSIRLNNAQLSKT